MLSWHNVEESGLWLPTSCRGFNHSQCNRICKAFIIVPPLHVTHTCIHKPHTYTTHTYTHTYIHHTYTHTYTTQPICSSETALRSQQHHHTITTTTATLSPSLGASPPSIHYTHINHTLVPSTSQEQYGKLVHSGTALAPEYSRLSHSQTLPAKPVTLLHPPTPQGHLCSHCSARQAATMPHLHHLTGQISYLSSSPSSHPYLSSSPSSHPHLPPSHTIVTSYLPGTHQTPPLRLVSRSQSAEESSPMAFQSSHTTEETQFNSHDIMSPTLL